MSTKSKDALEVTANPAMFGLLAETALNQQAPVSYRLNLMTSVYESWCGVQVDDGKYSYGLLPDQYPDVSLDEAIESLMSFYLYLFERRKSDTHFIPEVFRHKLYDYPTRIYSIRYLLSAMVDSHEDDITMAKVSDLALERWLPKERWPNPELPFGVAKEVLRPERARTYFHNETNPGLTQFLDTCSAMGNMQSVMATSPRLKSNQNTQIVLNLYSHVVCDYFALARQYGVTPIEALTMLFDVGMFLFRFHTEPRTGDFKADLLQFHYQAELLYQQINATTELHLKMMVYQRELLSLIRARLPFLAGRLPAGASIGEVVAAIKATGQVPLQFEGQKSGTAAKPKNVYPKLKISPEADALIRDSMNY